MSYILQNGRVLGGSSCLGGSRVPQSGVSVSRPSLPIFYLNPRSLPFIGKLAFRQHLNLRLGPKQVPPVFGSHSTSFRDGLSFSGEQGDSLLNSTTIRRAVCSRPHNQLETVPPHVPSETSLHPRLSPFLLPLCVPQSHHFPCDQKSGRPSRPVRRNSNGASAAMDPILVPGFTGPPRREDILP